LYSFLLLNLELPVPRLLELLVFKQRVIAVVKRINFQIEKVYTLKNDPFVV
jgi:hypothetical protein